LIFCERCEAKISLFESARGGRVRDFSEYKSLVFPDFYGSLVIFGTFDHSKVQRLSFNYFKPRVFLQDFGDFYRAVFLLVVFQNGS